MTALGALTAMGLSVNVQAGISIPACATDGDPEHCSHVTDSVTDLGGGLFEYEYRVHNDNARGGGEDGYGGLAIVDWELPYFADSGITDIDSPSFWHYEIETVGVANPLTGWDGEASWQDPLDPFYEGPTSPFTTGTEVLHWFSVCWAGEGAAGSVQRDIFNSGCEQPGDSIDAIFPGGSLDGFSFVAAFDTTPAPYQASWEDFLIRTGDPAFPLGAGVPASPSVTGVPETSTLALGLIGAVGLMLNGWRRRRSLLA